MQFDTHERAQQLAELAGKTMFERDPASQRLGMTLDQIRPGYARMSMRVREDMLNGHGTCHGGYIFMLADSAFAFACNSHNQRAVAAIRGTAGGACARQRAAEQRLGGVIVALGLQKRAQIFETGC